MTEDFQNVLYLFSCAAMGKKIAKKLSIDLNKLYEICAANGIWPIVYKFLAEEKTFPESFKSIEKKTINDIYKSVLQNANTANIVKELEKNGIECCILKGATLSELYSNPDARISSDVDIFIKDGIDEACEILKKNQFRILNRWVGSHHIKCISSRCKMIELHTEYFDKLVADLWFDGAGFIDAEFIPFTFEGVACHALNPTDGILFVFLHFVKHYISATVTVRQLMDTLLYLRKYKNEIDFEKINNVLDKLNYAKFFKICIAFGIKYLQFEKEDFGFTLQEDFAEETELFLQDLYNLARNNNTNIYNEYWQDAFLEKNKSGSYKKYSKKLNGGGILQMAKVNKNVMQEKYPILNKYKFLYPVCYVWRAVTGMWKLLSKPTKSEEQGNNRMLLVKKLGL